MTKMREVCIKARSPPASPPFKGQVTEQRTVKWSIEEKMNSTPLGKKKVLFFFFLSLKEVLD